MLYMSEKEVQELLRQRAEKRGEKMPEVSTKLPAEEPKRSKYGNRRVEVDGMKFDSLHEANVYRDLMLRKKAGQIRCVLRQVSFDLPGKIRYVADFVVINNDMTCEVWDAKSPATKENQVYKLKKKLMMSEWGLEIYES